MIKIISSKSDIKTIAAVLDIDIDDEREKRFDMAACMLSILDSLKSFDNNSLDTTSETLSEIMFRKMKAYNIDLNHELDFTHLKPVPFNEDSKNKESIKKV